MRKQEGGRRRGWWMLGGLFGGVSSNKEHGTICFCVYVMCISKDKMSLMLHVCISKDAQRGSVLECLIMMKQGSRWAGAGDLDL